MTARREEFMAAAAASIAAQWPARVVRRGIQDLASIGDDILRLGLYQVLAESVTGWTQYTGREGEYGRLQFAVLADARHVNEEATTLEVEQLEAVLEEEILQWVRAIKPPPLDAVYPLECTYSGGLEAPNAWIVMRLEATHV